MTDGAAILEEIVRRIRCGELRRIISVVEEGEGAPFMSLWLRMEGCRWFALDEANAYELVGYVDPPAGAKSEHTARCFDAPSVAAWLAHPWSQRPARGNVADIIQEITRVCV